jgi:hypothetical protein
MDRSGRGDEPDEQAYTDQDLEAEGDQPIPVPRTLAMIAPRPIPTVATIITSVS